jgi:GAF domain-containing protein
METQTKLDSRYERIYAQLRELLPKSRDRVAQMATAAALLHHKMPHYFWTGFYLLKHNRLVVGPYQGPVACQVLEGPEGVCWAGVHRKETVIVPDVHRFPGHVACDSRSQSEIVVPLFKEDGSVWAVLDVDSRRLDAFSDVDTVWLEKITRLLAAEP